MRSQRSTSGQSILEYILVTAMISVVIAMTIRGTTRTLYRYWTALAMQISSPCPDCKPAAKAPQLP